MRRLAPLALAFVPLAAAPAPETHPTSIELVELRKVTGLALSPEGARVAYVVTGTTHDDSAQFKEDDPKAGWKKTEQIWVAEVASRQARALTAGEAGATNPFWSSDGRTLGFLRKVGGKPVLHLLPFAGGEAVLLKTGELAAGAPSFSPDGKQVAFVAEAPLAEAERKSRWARGGASRYGQEYRPSRLYLVPVSGGEPRELPVGPNVVDYAWSPDGARLAVVTSESSDPYVVGAASRVSLVEASGNAPARQVSPGSGSPLGSSPVWSPDGRRIAWLGLKGGVSNFNAVQVLDVASSMLRDVAPGPDRTLTALAWSADSSAVLVASLVRTATRLERLPLQGTPSYLPFQGRVISSGLATDAASRRLAFTSSTDRSPEEVTVLDPASAAPVVVTDLNPQVAGWRLATTRVVAWKNSEGVALEGVLWVAPGAGPGKPAPLVVLPHGGPDWLTNLQFSGWAHYLASRGYSVFGPNYRGSVGYGFAFYEANRGRFGEIEQADVESGVDQLVADGLADARRLYFGGWSWGGYVTVWTIAHVQRYRAAVAGAAVSDTLHSYSLSDINHGVAAEWEFRGDPWNQPEAFDKPSPIRAVKGIRTPLLILHGDADGRVPWAESVQLWRALTDLGREVEFWSYPREDHMFAEPAHRVDFLKRWGDWYDAH